MDPVSAGMQLESLLKLADITLEKARRFVVLGGSPIVVRAQALSLAERVKWSADMIEACARFARSRQAARPEGPARETW